MTSPTQELPKRPFSGSNLKTSVPASKRLCKSTSTTSFTQTTGSPIKPLPSIQSIIELPEDEVWSLAKSDLRKYFFALQTYAQSPYALSATHASAEASSKESSSEEDVLPLPKILSLPVEIRELIYTHLLPPAKDHPIRGPHPRQLQTHLHLTQPFPYAILLVSRQIYNEALPIFYGAHSQTVYIKIDYNVWVHKTARSPLIISSALRAAIKHLHVTISLGCEKKNNKLGDVERDARLSEVVKGIKKARKWLAEADIHSLVIGWQEPPQTYTWEQKKEILDGLRPLQPKKVEAGEINWGLNWNKGRKYRFPIEHLKDLERSSNEYDRDVVR